MLNEVMVESNKSFIYRAPVEVNYLARPKHINLVNEVVVTMQRENKCLKLLVLLCGYFVLRNSQQFF